VKAALLPHGCVHLNPVWAAQQYHDSLGVGLVDLVLEDVR
jgi:hypothetical protein